MGNTLYLECYSGISGDMTVAALLDLGADPDRLNQVLKSLPVTGFQTKISRVKKSGLDVCDFSVILDEDNHDHDMEYLHGHGAHSHEDASHEEHFHGNADHAHSHRGIREIREILNAADLTDRARNTALKIFEILAEAEAEAHGVPLEEVHFHEVGAVDSIVDITAAAVCLDDLDITEVIVPCLHEGTGFIRCQHGTIPVPVPAVVNIVKNHNLNLKITGISGELVTPTGAAIVAAIRTSTELPENFRPQRIGMGGGKREYECPGILRAVLLDTEEERTDSIWRLETDVDDSAGEVLGYVMNRLYQAGAREVHYAPIFMKKNRPAYELTVICKEQDLEKLEDIIFSETTTIGIRKIRMERSILPRRMEKVETPYGTADVKICTLPNGEDRCYPEYESAAELAEKNGVSLNTVYDAIRAAYK